MVPVYVAEPDSQPTQESSCPLAKTPPNRTGAAKLRQSPHRLPYRSQTRPRSALGGKRPLRPPRRESQLKKQHHVLQPAGTGRGSAHRLSPSEAGSGRKKAFCPLRKPNCCTLCILRALMLTNPSPFSCLFTALLVYWISIILLRALKPSALIS
jgi:hypothetical protein